MIGKQVGPVSRRRMIAGLAGVAAAGGFGAWALPVGWYEQRKALVPASWWRRRNWTLATAGIREWTSQVGRSFVILGAHRELRLKLVEVRPFPSPGERPPEVSRDQAFAAIFDLVSRGRMANQDRIYRLASVRYGEMRVFLKPCGNAANPRRFEAVFN